MILIDVVDRHIKTEREIDRLNNFPFICSLGVKLSGA